jgi:hypothetical protein
MGVQTGSVGRDRCMEQILNVCEVVGSVVGRIIVNSKVTFGACVFQGPANFVFILSP